MLADWIVDLAQHGGYLAQATSVPGVAQRTGATVYYVELFPKARRAGRRARAGARAVADAGRRRRRARLRADGSGARGRARLRHPGTNAAHRLHPPRLRHDREDRAGRRPGGCGGAVCRAAATPRASSSPSTWRRWRTRPAACSARSCSARSPARAPCRFPRTAFEAAIRRGQVGVNSSLAAFGAGFEAARAGEAAAPAPRAARAPPRCPPPRPANCPRERASDFRGEAVPSSLRPSNGCAIIRMPITPRTSWHDCGRSSEHRAAATATAPGGCWRKPRASSRSA